MNVLNQLDFHTYIPPYLLPKRLNVVSERVHQIGLLLFTLAHAIPSARPLLKAITLISLKDDLIADGRLYSTLSAQLENKQITPVQFFQGVSTLDYFKRAFQILFPIPFLLAELQPAVVAFVSNPNQTNLFSLAQTLTYFFAITAQEWTPPNQTSSARPNQMQTILTTWIVASLALQGVLRLQNFYYHLQSSKPNRILLLENGVLAACKAFHASRYLPALRPLAQNEAPFLGPLLSATYQVTKESTGTLTKVFFVMSCLQGIASRSAGGGA